jgi:hypothetical protein
MLRFYPHAPLKIPRSLAPARSPTHHPRLHRPRLSRASLPGGSLRRRIWTGRMNVPEGPLTVAGQFTGG